MRWYIHEALKNDFITSKETAWETITKDLFVFKSKAWSVQKSKLINFCQMFEDEDELIRIVNSGNEFK